MYFSDVFNIADSSQHDWFDPILELDTRLFVDPFLIFKDKDTAWSNLHGEIIDYFERVYLLLADSTLNQAHQYYKRAVTLMEFPEPKEFRLGYTAKSANGAGGGKGLAGQIVKGMAEAIKRGLQDMAHFEELGIFVERFSRDRISDVTCNILKPQLIEYTQGVCQAHGIPTSEVSIVHGEFDAGRRRWISLATQVPLDPRTGKPILLVPKRFLKELPTLDIRNWYDNADTLRDDLNLDISQSLNTEDILDAARRNVEKYREWVKKQETKSPRPYDVDVDPELYWRWQKVAKEFAEQFPGSTEPVRTAEQMMAFVHRLVGYVAQWAEERSGWRLFWHSPGASIPEPNMQILLLGLLDEHCRANGIRVDREVETGKGPVDFVFSGDQRVRVLLEMKKLNHGAFWHGLATQTPQYMKSQNVDHAIFLVVKNSHSRGMLKRWNELPAQARAISQAENMTIEIAKLDVMPKASASQTSPISEADLERHGEGDDPGEPPAGSVSDLD